MSRSSMGDRTPAASPPSRRATVCLIPKAQILAMLEQHPKVAKAVIRLLASRLRALTLVIEDLSLRSVTARVAKLLLDCTRGHHTLVEGGAGDCARLTQHQIAAMTGSAREVVQRALKALEKDGAIRLERPRVLVLDPKRLERWSEPKGRPPPERGFARQIPSAGADGECGDVPRNERAWGIRECRHVE